MTKNTKSILLEIANWAIIVCIVAVPGALFLNIRNDTRKILEEVDELHTHIQNRPYLITTRSSGGNHVR